MHSFKQFAVIALAFLLPSTPAFAHKLMVECRVDGDRVRVLAFYDDDAPAQQARIVVENEHKKVVAAGRTDERGLWSCPAPAPGNYTVRAESVGHEGEATLVIAGNASSQPAAQSETPWLRIAIGFGIIAFVCVGLLFLRKRQHPSKPVC